MIVLFLLLLNLSRGDAGQQAAHVQRMRPNLLLGSGLRIDFARRHGCGDVCIASCIECLRMAQSGTMLSTSRTSEYIQKLEAEHREFHEVFMLAMSIWSKVRMIQD